MSDSNESPMRGDSPAAAEGDALASRIERLRGLRSAFTALAASALNDEGRTLSQIGRDLTQRLTEARRAPAPPDASALARLDADLDAFERSMRTLARGLPIPQMRSMLPGRLARDRASVLDLLDLLLGGRLDEGGRLAERIGAIDYLITLLCTYGARRTGAVVHDPVSLTPRLAELCARADELCDARVDAAETEFYGAAGMDRESLREEFQRRTLRQRKVELGPLFFSSRILRAIVTYNAALLERVTDEIHEAGDWGPLEGEAATDRGDRIAAVSLFESKPLRRLAAALRRRVRGQAAEDGPEARIAAALDLETLEPSEREALAGEAVATPDDPIGTAILIGVLCRSLAVLSVDLQRFGIEPDDVSDPWVAELDRVFETRIDEKREQDAYKQACALAELRNKFLLEPLAERLREERSTTHPHAPRETSASPHAASTRAPTGRRPGSVDDAATTTTASSPAPASGAATGPETAATATAPSATAATSAPARAATATATAASGATPTRATASAAAPAAARAERGAPGGARSTKPEKSPRPARARDLVREALEEDRRGRSAEKQTSTPSGFRPARFAKAAVVALAIAAAGYLFLARGDRDLAAFGREQLAVVSPHLVEGHRNGRGHGPGFVGTLDEGWGSLSAAERQSAAEEMVARLREHGLDQVMVYDRARTLRIQAIGSQPVRAL